jgi:hypothetical protein
MGRFLGLPPLGTLVIIFPQKGEHIVKGSRAWLNPSLPPQRVCEDEVNVEQGGTSIPSCLILMF